MTEIPPPTALVLAAQAGDQTAFETLVKVYQRELLVYCYRMLGSFNDAEDLLICTHFDPDHAGNHDAFPWAELVVQRTPSPWHMDDAGVRASTRKLVELAQREHVALIVHGHDPVQWHTLKKAPDYYC